MNDTIKILEKDYNYLCNLIKNEKGSNTIEAGNIAYLGNEIKRAERIKDQTDDFDFVTMNSLVEFTDIQSNKKMKVKLVQPSEANFKNGTVSIFSMLGSALLGYQKGSEVVYHAPAGERKIRIDHITYPEEDISIVR